MTGEELDRHQAAHIALYRHQHDPEAPSPAMRAQIKELVFHCIYGVNPCGWRPSDEEVARHERYDKEWLDSLDYFDRFAVLQQRAELIKVLREVQESST